MLSDGVGRDGDACNLYCHEQCATCRETCRKVGSTILPKYAPSASQPYPRCVLRYLSSAVFSLTRCRLQSPRQRRPLRFLPQLWRGGGVACALKHSLLCIRTGRFPLHVGNGSFGGWHRRHSPLLTRGRALVRESVQISSNHL